MEQGFALSAQFSQNRVDAVGIPPPPMTVSSANLPPSAVNTVGGARILPVGVLLSGTVRRWNMEKGFGFIVPEGGGPDVFVHARELPEGEVLVQGSKVMYEAMEDQSKGPGMFRAKRVVGGVRKDQSLAATPPSDNLFVTGLPSLLAEESIQAIFGQYGSVASVKKLPATSGKTDTAALVRMGDIEQATWLVVHVNGNIPTGLTTPVMVSFAEQKRSGVGAPAMGTAGFGPVAKLGATTSSPYEPPRQYDIGAMAQQAAAQLQGPM